MKSDIDFTIVDAMIAIFCANVEYNTFKGELYG